SGVWCLAFSADGKRLLSGGDDFAVRQWDLGTGKCVAVYKGHSQRVAAVAFGSDGKTLITASRHGSSKLWHTAMAAPPTAGKQAPKEPASNPKAVTAKKPIDNGNPPGAKLPDAGKKRADHAPTLSTQPSQPTPKNRQPNPTIAPAAKTPPSA